MLNKLKVAGLNVEVGYKYPTMVKQAEYYKTDFEKADITIDIPEETLVSLQKENPHLSMDDCEYIFTGARFYESVLDFGGMLLHSSCIMTDGYAYMFTADSGVGKSTHAGLWRKYLGDDKVKVINDDKPVIRIKGDEVFACGTPWSGKTDMNMDIKAPIGAVVCVERAEKSFVERITPSVAIPLLMQQTLRPREIDKMNTLLDVLNKLLTNVPVYRLGCDISKEAFEVCYNTVKVR